MSHRDYVQVEASSPIRSPRHLAPGWPPSAAWSTGLVPLGTTFRPPKKDVICISDDEDHKTPSAVCGSPMTSGVRQASDLIDQSTHEKKSSPTPGSRDVPYPLQARQQVVLQNDQDPGTHFSSIHRCAGQDLHPKTLDDIPDSSMRIKVQRMLSILPKESLTSCWSALIATRANVEDALERMILGREQSRRQLSGQAENQARADSIVSATPSTGYIQTESKVHARKIHQRWATEFEQRQAGLKIEADSSAESSKSSSRASKRRLVRGRRQAQEVTPPVAKILSSPVILSDPVTKSPPPTPTETHDEEFLFNFNSCSSHELLGLGLPLEVIQEIISRGPYKSKDAIRQEASSISVPKRNSAKVDMFIDKCNGLFSAYLAIDALISQCQHVARPVLSTISNWGIDISDEGALNGELQVTDTIQTRQGYREDFAQSSDCEKNSGCLRGAKMAGFESQPSMIREDFSLKDYQLFGMNWLLLLFKNGLSGILADDMGLGKTCQVIAFLACLYEKGFKGPHLIIVPGSTLENWLREFRQICPKLNVFPYYADQKERYLMRQNIKSQANADVVITTYTIAKALEDNKFLRRLKPVCCIFDEGHILKNKSSAGYGAYMRIPAKFRLLLTGTPLQNNLQELICLLAFILPSVFEANDAQLQELFSIKATTQNHEDSHAAFLSTSRTSRARALLAPFLLRRKKHQVLKHLPAKYTRTLCCQMTQNQAKLYDQEKHKAEGSEDSSSNVMMTLRKAAIHPLLFRQIFTDETLRKMTTVCKKMDEFASSDPAFILEDLSVMNDIELHHFCNKWSAYLSQFQLSKTAWMDSGKVQALISLLNAYARSDDQVLIFSQFIMVLDILSLVMSSMGITFCRLDGTTPMEERQLLIDKFHEDRGITVFMLSTKAGGAGINLTCANKVVIFDSSFNPQDDIQAENRAHRVGQTREVEVVRLVSSETVEEQMQALSTAKVALDTSVSNKET